MLENLWILLLLNNALTLFIKTVKLSVLNLQH